MLKLSATLLLITLLVLLTACADEARLEKLNDAPTEGSIWVLLPDSATSTRWETDDRRFFDQALSKTGVPYTIVNAEGDSRTQQAQAEQAIAAGAKVILLVNLDSGSGAAIIAQAHQVGVKVIDYDRLTVEGPGADLYVSFDNVEVGRIMGETLAPLINSQAGIPQVALLNGAPTDNNATLFREGYYGIAEPYFKEGLWHLVADQPVSNWNNQEALIIFEQILTITDNDVTAVFAANDGVAGAVISAFKNAGIDPSETDIYISGMDATVGGMQNILSGDQTMTVYKPVQQETQIAVDAAVALFNDANPAELTNGLTINNGINDIPFISLQPIGVTKSNIADTVIADGFRTWEEICVGTFERYCPEDR